MAYGAIRVKFGLGRTLPGVTYRTKICDENTSYINRLNYYES
jgi:hypothetical protein